MTVPVRYLLDTNVLIDYSKGYDPARSLIVQLLQSAHIIGVCSIVVAELKAGLPLADHAQWDVFLSTLEFWDISYRAASRAGEYRFAFGRQGRTIHLPDSLLAGVAYDLGAVLVTSNARDFPMSDISLLVP